MPCPSTDLPTGRRDERWRNYIRSVDTNVDIYWEPDSLRKIVRILQDAEIEEKRVHAVGAGFSFEDLATTEDWMVDLIERPVAGTARPSPLIAGLVGEGFASEALTNTWRDRHLGGGHRKLVHVKAGARLFDICRYLDSHHPPLALPTMGGAHGQQLAGAFSTSTHGSDVEQPPLCDFVRAVHLVTVGGQELWLESGSDPLTADDVALRSALQASEDIDDRACDDLQIIRSDDLLHAVVCAMGRFGVIYSVVYEVTTAFRLAEWVDELEWRNVRPLLLEGLRTGAAFTPLEAILSSPPDGLVMPEGGSLPNYRYLDISFNTRNNETCWVRRRWETILTPNRNETPTSDFLCQEGSANGVLLGAANALRVYANTVLAPIPFYNLGAVPAALARAGHLELLASSPHVTGGQALSESLNAIWSTQIDLAPLDWLIDQIIQRTVTNALYPHDTRTEGRRASNWVISAGSRDPGNIGNCYRGNSIEMIFGLQNEAYVGFIDAMLGEARNRKQAGYMSVRFSHSSAALISMHNVPHNLACSIEVTSLDGLSDNAAWMRWLEDTGLRLGGRPHWGQQNRLNDRQVQALYGDGLLKWRAQLERIVGSNRTFSNAYTAQRGLEPARERLAYAAWTNSHTAFVEAPERLVSEQAIGAYTRYTGQSGSENQLHIAIPTPVIIAERRISVGSALIRYRLGEGARITRVWLYDGERQLAVFPPAEATAGEWRLDRFHVATEPEIYWGVSITLELSFAASGYLDFAAAGTDFIDWTY